MSNSTSWHSYPKVYEMGHAAIKELLLDDVFVQEKVDGSQFSFGRFEDGLKVKSKGVEMSVESPEKMFQEAVDHVKLVADKLQLGWTYRAEYLRVPKHNTLSYSRTPKNFLIVFDINVGHEEYLDPELLAIEAHLIGLEAVPLIYKGKLDNLQTFTSMLEMESCLGGVKVEGLVVKNYKRFGADKKVLMGKHVSEQFKEQHETDWKGRHPQSGDVTQILVKKYRTEARWRKSLQHLSEAGKIEGSPRDIALLIKEAQRDLREECKGEIQSALYDYMGGKIERGATAGIAEWYKGQLLEKQFKEGQDARATE